MSAQGDVTTDEGRWGLSKLQKTLILIIVKCLTGLLVHVQVGNLPFVKRRLVNLTVLSE